MTALEIMATLGLDTSDFDSKLTGAVEDVQGLNDKAEELTKPKLGGSTQTVLQPMIDDAKEVDEKLVDIKTKTTETSAFVEGLLDATSEVVKKFIESMVDFAAASIEAAAATGSELANSFNNAKDSFTLGLEILKVETGEKLLPIMELFYELGDAIVGKETSDKLYYLGEQLEKLSQINLEKVRGEVKSTFALFEEVEKVEPGNVGDYQKGLESQTEYWQEYAETLNSLKEKNIDPTFLSKIATGSAESLEKLKALDTADTEGLTNLMSAYTELQAAQEVAATSLNSVKLSVDESATAIADAFAVLTAGGIVGDTTSWSGPDAISKVVQGYTDSIAEKYPALESMVNQINAKLAELGVGENLLGLTGPTGEDGTDTGQDGEQKSSLVARVDVVIAEGSEEGLQSEVDSMSLGGDVLVVADPTSGSKIQGYLDGLNLTATVTLNVDDSALGGYGDGRAVGLDYVPYDNYAARLHEGEAVLTKLEADRWRRGEFNTEGGDGIVVNQYITVAKNEDFGTEVRNALEMMRWNA